MYRQSFGIVAPPFQLTPDPAFYFDSRSHRGALNELRRGVEEASPFIVVSGEIGAGKTTLVRTLLAEFDPATVAVANIVSTQLDADEIVAVAAIGFGVPADTGSCGDADTALRRFLAGLDAQSRRAVLVIDEAQHLSCAALERLAALAADRAPRRLPLQVWLVGQPELRTTLDVADAAPLRRQVGVWCHLGPIDREETGIYIEHRLRKVGWNGTPSFDAGAFDEIFRSTLGIPRRINLLCNRLLLSRFLAAETTINRATVVQTARELSTEIGEPQSELPSLSPALSPPTLPLSNVVSTARLALTAQSFPRAPSVIGPAPFLFVVADRSDHIKAAGLIRAMEANGATTPVALLRVHDNDALAYAAALYGGLRASERPIALNLPDDQDDSISTDLAAAFASLVVGKSPRAVVVFDGSRAALACAQVAKAKEVPLVHVGAGLRVRNDDALLPGRRRSVDQLADLLFTTDAQASATLQEEGVRPDRVHCVGALSVDAVHLALQSPAVSISRRPGRAPPRYFADTRGYALVVIGHPTNIEDRLALTELMVTMFEISRVIPLLWPMRSRLHEQLKRFRLEPFILKERVRRMPTQRYVDYALLLRYARCVVTDSWNVQEEASGLGIPCLAIGAFEERPIPGTVNVPVGRRRAIALSALWEIVLSASRRVEAPPPLWDGNASVRIAKVLADVGIGSRERSPPKTDRTVRRRAGA